MHLFRALTVLAVLTVGCGKSSTKEEGAAPAASSSVGDDRPKKPQREKKDRGEASLVIGGETWEATSARATIAGTQLRIVLNR